MKELFIFRLLVLCICILLQIYIFGDFSNTYKFSTKNGMTMGHLNWYDSKSFEENFKKKIHEDEKIDVKKVCQVSVNICNVTDVI